MANPPLTRSLNHDQNVGFAHEFRAARATALRDAEAFEEHLFVLERLGSFVCGHQRGLKSYEPALRAIASHSPLAELVANEFPALHLPFDTLFDQIREARNDAMHQGAVARLLAGHAQELALIMEDGLMSNAGMIKDFMVRDPACAESWQPLGTLRRSMLINAFSFLPFQAARDKKWHLVSDYALARYLREPRKERERRMLRTLGEALHENTDFRRQCAPAKIVSPCDLVATVVGDMEAEPSIVLDATGRIIGIVTAFDIL